MNIQDPKAIFKEYCRKKGMRYTSERDVIIEEAYRRDGHFDIDNLFLRSIFFVADSKSDIPLRASIIT